MRSRRGRGSKLTDREKIARILFACGWGENDSWEKAERRGANLDYWLSRADAILDRLDKH